MEHVDVVIVGSGFGGSIPALRLAETGRKVVVLETGRRNTSKDFRHSWELRYMQSLYNFLQATDLSVFFRYARTLGGGSMLFSGACLRAPSEVFQYVDPWGYKVWPDEINRSVMDVFYAKVEEKLSIRQARWDEVPKTGAIFAMMLDRLDHTCDRGRFNYVDCIQCGFCEAGCIYDRKRTLLHTYIPQAEALGAEFRTECEAWTIRPSTQGATVSYKDRHGTLREIEGSRVILAGGAIETPSLLLRSKDNLPKMSLQVGKNLNNNGDLAFYFLLPESGFPSFFHYMGRTNAVMITYDFWAEHKITIHTGCPPPGIFAALDIHREGELPWGLAHKTMAHDIYLQRLIGVLAIGLVPGVGTITIGPTGKPQVKFPITPELSAYIERVKGVMTHITQGNQAELLKTNKDGYEHGDAHPMGTCRMGYDPQVAVVDPYGTMYNYPMISITDGSTIPGGTGVNPALTIAANAERIAAHLV